MKSRPTPRCGRLAILFLWLISIILFCGRVFSQTVPTNNIHPTLKAVMVDTNGAVQSPTNLFAANSNALLTAIGGAGGGGTTNIATTNVAGLMSPAQVSQLNTVFNPTQNLIPTNAAYAPDATIGQPSYTIRGLQTNALYLATFPANGYANDNGLMTDSNTFDGPNIENNLSYFYPSNGYALFFGVTNGTVVAQLFKVQGSVGSFMGVGYGSLNGAFNGSVAPQYAPDSVSSYLVSASNKLVVGNLSSMIHPDNSTYNFPVMFHANGNPANWTNQPGPGATQGNLLLVNWDCFQPSAVFFAAVTNSLTGGSPTIYDPVAGQIGMSGLNGAEYLFGGTFGMIADPPFQWVFGGPQTIGAETNVPNHEFFGEDPAKGIFYVQAFTTNAYVHTNVNSFSTLKGYGKSDSTHAFGSVGIGSDLYVPKQIFIGTNNTGKLIANANGIIISSNTPASSSATNYIGAVSYDASYLYVWTATNVNKRIALSSW